MRTLIVPAAGEGSRFKKAGINTPKPFIKVDGKELISHAIEPFVGWAERIIILLSDSGWVSFLGWYMGQPESLKQKLLGLPLAETQKGAALTLLCANGQLADSDEVMVVDCDMKVDVPDGFWKRLEQMRPDGALLTFPAPDGGPFAFVERRNDDPTFAARVVEKDPISGEAACGAYYFRRWSRLRRAICSMVANYDMHRGEFYVSPAFNYIIAKGGVVTPYITIPGAFHALGTPEQVEAYRARC